MAQPTWEYVEFMYSNMKSIHNDGERKQLLLSILRSAYNRGIEDYKKGEAECTQ